ncbi:MAG TPA: serpin family protein [Myxococcota bacterium]|nr:serpin family protein [Myxococcota bacterium]HQP96777.1 serpin family protein [Myxococcota bacterium]
MRRFILLAGAVLALSGCDNTVDPAGMQVVSSDMSRDMAPSGQGIETLTAGNSAFGFELYLDLAARNEGKNVFISPHSVSSALAMAYAGARGETASQMRQTLGFGEQPESTFEAFNALDLELDRRGSEQLQADEKGDPFELSVVNQAWGRIGFEFLQPYLDVLAVNFGAGLRLMDFTNDPDGSRVVINDWVAEQTRDRIPDLLPEGSISPATALVLTNAIYFKASWRNKFDKEDTVDDEFTRLDGATVGVKMMKAYDELRHFVGDGYEYLEIPYVGDKVVMALILPDAGRFDEVEAGLSGDAFASMVQGSVDAAGYLRMPRFTFEFESSLNDSLKAMGMTAAFSAGGADFSGIDGIPGNLFISLVQHKSFVAVDEEGTEAAAATAVVMDETSAPMDTFDMTFDRPFMFAIVDQLTGAVLFVGRVVDPSA